MKLDDVTFQELKSLYDARPFQPFELVLESGKRLLVDQPEFVGWSIHDQTVVWSNERDTFDVLPMSNITAVRRVRARRSNGTKRRRGGSR